ncbi:MULTISPECIES: hypothetical protein [Rhizobium]|uniref:hypothetical protein n=1 Tax=Rhizobium TaxID=379 RepID=UPI0035B51FE3
MTPPIRSPNKRISKNAQSRSFPWPDKRPTWCRCPAGSLSHWWWRGCTISSATVRPTPTDGKHSGKAPAEMDCG